MGTLWEDLVGSKVGDGYLLRSMIGKTERSAVYQTFYGEYGAAIKLAAIDDAAPAIPQLDHPRIVGLFASGRCEVSGTPLHYFVTEAAEENLGSVVAARALTPEEAAEMLKPVLEALTFLHGRGLAHGSIKPGNILAHGDSVKLSVDTIRASGAIASPEEDMRALGLTIIEVLTQERQPSAIADIPQPLRDIVEHSLLPGPQLRWTAAQAAMRLSGKMPIQAAPNPISASTSAPAPKPAPVPVDEAPSPSSMNPYAGQRQRVPFWALPATAAVMLMAVIYVLAKGTGQPSDSSMAASAPAPTVTAPAPVVKAPPPPVTTPSRPQPVFQPKPSAIEPRKTIVEAASKPAAVSASNRTAAKTLAGARGWFVVSASYTKEEDAAHEASLLSHKFPNFKPSVFPPSAIDTHYLVILGAGLSSDGAEALRQRAVASGLPPDTYIKKYPSRAP